MKQLTALAAALAISASALADNHGAVLPAEMTKADTRDAQPFPARVIHT